MPNCRPVILAQKWRPSMVELEELAELGEQLVAGLVALALVQLVQLVEADHEDPRLLAVRVATLVVAAELRLPCLAGGGAGQSVAWRVVALVATGAGGKRALGSGECAERVGQQRDQRFGVGRHRGRAARG